MSLLDHAAFPRRRETALLCMPTGSDLILLDEETNALHILGSIASFVWHHANGRRSIPDIAELGKVEPSHVAGALRALARADLMLSSDIIAAVYRHESDHDASMVQSFNHGLAWIAGYHRVMADSGRDDLPSAQPLKLATLRFERIRHAS